MFLYFHEKYNMILFVLKIFDRMQIKTFNSFFYLFYFFNIYKTYIKNTKTHTSLFTMLNSHIIFTCYKITKIQNKSNTIQKLQNKPQKSRNCQKAFWDLSE